jgi:hypothetical protein
MRSIRLVAIPAALVAFCLALPAAALAGDWEVITKEEGITVSKKEVAGKDLATFRGTGVVHASLYEILAVLNDTDRNADWMHNCHSAELLKQVDEVSRVIYNRTKAPWPVSDRDVVLRSTATWNVEKRTVMVRFKSIQSPLKGEVDDVVRMPKLQGYYKLVALDWDKTRVTYQVDADPGGSLPDWVVNAVQTDIPLHTLLKLRAQVKKMRGKYPEFIKLWDPRQGGKAPLPDGMQIPK